MPGSAAENVLEVHGLSSGYGRTQVLRDVSITVPQGSVTALLGPNGAGKTTLLKTICGLVPATEGRVVLDGLDITRLPANRRDRHGLCLIPEGRGVFRSLTVQENLRLQALPGEEHLAVDRATEAFPILGDRLDQLAGTLSGGQQQMLAVARAYVRNPKVIVVDEASLGLAPVVVDAIFRFLVDATRSGSALLLVDQFVTRALAMADRAYVLGRGEVVFAGGPSELASSDVFSTYLGGSEAAPAAPARATAIDLMDEGDG